MRSAEFVVDSTDVFRFACPYCYFIMQVVAMETVKKGRNEQYVFGLKCPNLGCGYAGERRTDKRFKGEVDWKSVSVTNSGLHAIALGESFAFDSQRLLYALEGTVAGRLRPSVLQKLVEQVKAILPYVVRFRKEEEVSK